MEYGTGIGMLFGTDSGGDGFVNPDWARTHPAAESTAPVVSAILSGGATSIGITVTAEMAYRWREQALWHTQKSVRTR